MVLPPADEVAAWSLPEWVAAVLAVAPAGLGGVYVRGPSGPESEEWRALASELVPGWRSVGPSIDPEHLTGDIAGPGAGEEHNRVGDFLRFA